MAVGGWDYRVRIYDCRKKRALASLKYHIATVSCVSFSTDGALLASCGRDANIALWSVFPPKNKPADDDSEC